MYVKHKLFDWTRAEAYVLTWKEHTYKGVESIGTEFQRAVTQKIFIKESVVSSIKSSTAMIKGLEGASESNRH